MAVPSAPYYANQRWGGPKGLRIPQEVAPADFAVVKEVDIDVGGAGTTNTVNLTSAQAEASYITITNSGSGATTVVWPAAFPGLVVAVYNNTSQSSVWKVDSQTGITVATTKKAILVCGASDFARLTADI